MNNLDANDYTKPSSMEEMSSILELLQANGIEVEETTWYERNDVDVYIEFPYIIWLCTFNMVIGIDYTSISMHTNQLSVSEFIYKSGCGGIFYHGRTFKHHMI